MKTGCIFHYQGAGRIAICRDIPRPRPAGRGALRRYPALAPPRDLLKRVKAGEISPGRFAELYDRVVLSRLYPVTVWDELHNLVGSFSVGPDTEPVLLCWEHLRQPSDFCHRRIVAAWFEHHLKPHRVPEIGCPVTKKQLAAEAQPSLFEEAS